MVQEIIRPSAVIPVPNAPDFISGVINFRTRIIPVLDAAGKLNISQTSHAEHNIKFLVLDIQGTSACIPVDSISGIHEPDDSTDMTSNPAPESASANYLKGACQVDGRQMNILDPARLLDADERGQLETLGPAAEGTSNV